MAWEYLVLLVVCVSLFSIAMAIRAQLFNNYRCIAAKMVVMTSEKLSKIRGAEWYYADTFEIYSSYADPTENKTMWNFKLWTFADVYPGIEDKLLDLVREVKASNLYVGEK